MTILIVADIHGNREAFEAVLAAAGTVDAVWCLGDVVGYGPDPGWCVDRVLSLAPSVWLAGNHDLAAIGRIDASDFNTVAHAAITWTTHNLSADQVATLGALPSLTEANGITLAHGSPIGPEWEYVADQRTASRNLDVLTTDLCVVGHTHVAAVSERPQSGPVIHRAWKRNETVYFEGRKLILNPGSVGQPRDFDPRASFGLLDLDRESLELRRVPYDIAAVQAKIRDAGLPEFLARRIAEGR